MQNSTFNETRKYFPLLNIGVTNVEQGLFRGAGVV